MICYYNKQISLCFLIFLPFIYSWIWPLSGNNTVDLRQSSPFGPRLKASESYRYDYHRGIDIPCPMNTSLYAVHGGEVRIAGSHASYSDLVVQIKHTIGSINVYSNYLHLNTVYVAENDIVTEGQLIATSGESAASGFDHLHFELRRGGVLQRNCINPWTYLPYVNTSTLFVSVPKYISFNKFSKTVYNITVMITSPSNPTELDFDFVYLTAHDKDGNKLTSENMYKYNLSFNEITYEQTPYVGGSSNIQILDNPTIPSRQVVVSPHRYNGIVPYEKAGWNFTFYDIVLPSKTCTVQAHGQDLKGNEQKVTIQITSCNVNAASHIIPSYTIFLAIMFLLMFSLSYI